MKRILAMAALCAMMCTACHNAEHHDHEHDHEHNHSHENHESAHAHSHEAVQISLYDDNWEIFAETEPLLAGQQAELLVHITSLPSFKPLRDGKVSVSLSAGGSESTAEASPAATEGIYKASLTPASEGRARLSFNVGGTVLDTEVTVYHCEHDAEEAAVEIPEAGGNRVSFTKEQSWKVDFATEVCRREAIGQVIRSAGEILPAQNGTQIITAKAAGIVSFERGSLLPGSPVHRGEALLFIGSKGMADSNMDVRYIEAKSEYERASGEYTRKAALAESKIVSQSELSEAKAAYESAKAAYENLESNYRDGLFAATSDIDGYVGEVLVSNGEYVEAGRALASVNGGGRLLVEARLQAKWHRQLSLGVESANFKFPGDDRVWSLGELDGRLVSVGRKVSADSPLIPVCFEISDRASVLPGTFAEVLIKTKGGSEAVTVASGAVVEEMGNYFVYKQITPELFEKVQVGVGSSDGVRTEITSGLNGDERVVSRGAVIVKLAQAAGGLDAHSGHVH